MDTVLPHTDGDSDKLLLLYTITSQLSCIMALAKRRWPRMCGRFRLGLDHVAFVYHAQKMLWLQGKLRNTNDYSKTGSTGDLYLNKRTIIWKPFVPSYGCNCVSPKEQSTLHRLMSLCRKNIRLEQDNGQTTRFSQASQSSTRSCQYNTYSSGPLSIQAALFSQSTVTSSR